MKKVLLGIGLTILIIVWLLGNGKNRSLVLQPVQNSVPVASPNAPKTFQFDSSTDLKQELEKVNPQILDSDFQ